MTLHKKFDEGRLFHGDCLSVMANDLKPASVDLVFGSPPYEDIREYKEGKKSTGIAKRTDKWVDWMVIVYQHALRVSKGLVCFVVGHGTGYRDWSAGPALLMAALKDEGIILRRPCYYMRDGVPGSGGNDWFRATIEWIICAANSADKLNFSDNKAEGTKPKYPPGGAFSNRKSSGERVHKKSVVEIKITVPSDVIKCSVGGSRLGSKIAHDNEAPFPLKLPTRFIKSFVPPGGIVLDPFMGSGTTLEAAILLDRRFVGIDLRLSQMKLCERRYRAAMTNKGFTL